MILINLKKNKNENRHCYEGGLDENGKPARANLAGFIVFFISKFLLCVRNPTWRLSMDEP